MRQRKKHKKKRVTAGILLCGAAACASLFAGWAAGGKSSSLLSPSEAIALRFPDARYDVWDNAPDQAAPAVDRGEDRLALFNPNPTLPVPPDAGRITSISVTSDQATGALAAPKLASAGSVAVTLPAADAAPAKAPMKLASVATKPALPPVPKTRPGAVLNDAQIASIKTRLKLNPEQQEMWPAVEAALRDLSYERKSDDFGARKTASPGAKPGTIDPYSPEVQRLKSAAFPMIMSFSDEQKRELRVIAHVAGLEKLAAQF